MNLKKKTVFFVILTLLVFVLFMATPVAQTKDQKEYQKGQFVEIAGREYLVVSNRQFVEILQISSDNQLRQASEIHGMENVNDLGVMEINNKPYLFVLTGQFIFKYDISNPFVPVVELKRNLYDWKVGHYAIGYMLSMSVTDNHIFTAGEKGVRRFSPDNLFVDKIYYYENARSVSASSNVLAVQTPEKGLIYNIASGNLIKEVVLMNRDNAYVRESFVDNNNNVYFSSDNALYRVDGVSKDLSTYYNPVEPGLIHSYAASAINSDDIFYANGFGLTKLNRNMKKEIFFHGSNLVNGRGAWTMGVDVDYVNGSKKIAAFNNSSIIFLDDNFKVLDRYRYAPASISSITTPTDLNILVDDEIVFENDNLEVSLYGFWPNETVSLGFYESKERKTVKTDNRGFAKTSISVPDLEAGMQIISAIGEESKMSYQRTVKMQ